MAIDLEGWTSDVNVADRLRRLPQHEWPVGHSNSSIVMGAFLHVAATGMRFNDANLGAWYASDEAMTAAHEVGHHLWREMHSLGVPEYTRSYQGFSANLQGSYRDIRGMQASMSDIYKIDDYGVSQTFGQIIRASSSRGILFDSLRRPGYFNVVSYRPSDITNVTPLEAYTIVVRAVAPWIDVTIAT